VFEPSPHYTPLETLGSGSYGLVCKAESKTAAPGEEGMLVAVKMISSVFKENLLLAKRTLREVCVLRKLSHPNVISILDLYKGQVSGRLFLVTQLMDTDLDQIIRSDQPLHKAHITHITLQIVLGVKYLHEVGLIHRDLKPANVLINEDCSIRIADLGMARLIGRDETDGKDTPLMTEYVVSRWWRAPEVNLLCVFFLYVFFFLSFFFLFSFFR
jgi:serine/threonine protein kinase